jgi:GNAT superfamily N-acetyltransferase
MRIRAIADSDIVAVVQLALANYDGVLAEYHSAEVLAVMRADVNPESLRRQMADKQVFVTEDASGIVATGALADYGTPPDHMYTVSQFYVRPDLHRCGIGQRLLDHLTALAADTGADVLHVPSSRPAIPFYEQAGFVVDELQPDTALEQTWMTRPL